MSKKSQFLPQFMPIMAFILVFGLFIFIFLFFTVGFKQMMSENIIAPTVNATTTGLNSSGVTLRSDVYGDITGLQNTYASNWFDYDLFFIVFFLSAFVYTIYSASKVQTPNFYTFWGMSTFGTMAFLLVLTLVGQVRDWLLLNLYTNLFDLSLVSTPIIDWFLSNIQMISFIWFLILLLVAFLEWDMIKDAGNDTGGYLK